MFSKRRGLQQSINILFQGSIRGIFQHRGRVRQRRRKARQIEAHATQQGNQFSPLSRLQSFFLQTGHHERVNLVPRPGSADLRRFSCGQWLKRPVPGITGTFPNPLNQQLLLFSIKLLAGRGRRHLRFGIIRKNAFDEFAFRGISSRHDRGCRLALVQAQFCFATLGIRSVALKTGLRQDRPYVLAKTDWLVRSGQHHGGRQHQHQPHEH